MRCRVRRLVTGILLTSAVCFWLVIVLVSTDGQEEYGARRNDFGPNVRAKRTLPEGMSEKDVVRVKLQRGRPTRNEKIHQALKEVSSKRLANTSTDRGRPLVNSSNHSKVDHYKADDQLRTLDRNLTKEESTALMWKFKHLLDLSDNEKYYDHTDYSIDHIWPTEGEQHDRILSQINHEPRRKPDGTRDVMTILAWNGLPDGSKGGRSQFASDKCKVQECQLTANKRTAQTADVILFQNRITPPYPGAKLRNQIWVLFLLESPLYTMNWHQYKHDINLTASYKRDSDIVTPYEKFLPHKDVNSLPVRASRNYAGGRMKKVAWFVSNCGSSNGRLAYAKELQKHNTSGHIRPVWQSKVCQVIGYSV